MFEKHSPQHNLWDILFVLLTKIPNVIFLLLGYAWKEEINGGWYSVGALLISEAVLGCTLLLGRLGYVNKRALAFKVLVVSLVACLLLISKDESSIRIIKTHLNTDTVQAERVLRDCNICEMDRFPHVYFTETMHCTEHSNLLGFNPTRSVKKYQIRDEDYLDVHIDYERSDLSYSTNVVLNFTVACSGRIRNTVYVTGFESKATGTHMFLTASALLQIYKYLLYLPLVCYAVSLQFEGITLSLVLNNFLLTQEISAYLKLLIAYSCTACLSNMDETVCRKTVLLLKTYFVRESLKSDTNCLVKICSQQRGEYLMCRLTRHHIQAGGTRLNKARFLKTYFSGLLMKPLAAFTYFDTIKLLIDQQELNIVKGDLGRKLFSRQGYTKDYTYFLESLGAVSHSYALLKRKSAGVFRITETRRRLNEFLCKNLTLNVNKFLQNHNAVVVNFNFQDILTTGSLTRAVKPVDCEEIIDGDPINVKVEGSKFTTERTTYVMRNSIITAGINFKYSKVRLGTQDISFESVMSEWESKQRERRIKDDATRREKQKFRRQILDKFFQDRPPIKMSQVKRNNLRRSGPLKSHAVNKTDDSIKSHVIYSSVHQPNYVDFTTKKTKAKRITSFIQGKKMYYTTLGELIGGEEAMSKYLSKKNRERMEKKVKASRHGELTVDPIEFISKLRERGSLPPVKRGYNLLINAKTYQKDIGYYSQFTVEPLSFKNFAKLVKDTLSDVPS